jgi:hypothetical protein
MYKKCNLSINKQIPVVFIIKKISRDLKKKKKKDRIDVALLP